MNVEEGELKAIGLNSEQLQTCLHVLETLNTHKQLQENLWWKRIRANVKRFVQPIKKTARKKPKICNEEEEELRFKCYMCRVKCKLSAFRILGQRLCHTCDNLNLQKRLQTADLTRRNAIVTGCRIKIGFEITLKLLRANCCLVIGTTRFVKDALERFQKETDYDMWKDKLILMRVDFLSRKDVECFCQRVLFLCNNKLDILINNAAQTIWRPPAFYTELYLKEQLPICNQEDQSLIVSSSCAVYFPEGQKDADGQQVDLRPYNSWISTLETTSIEEVLQNQIINCTVPFLLLQRFTQALTKKDNHCFSFVINVSAVEGLFDISQKSSRHVASNLAKAGLNMITRTEAKRYLTTYNIVINSVDTGFVTNEFPHQHESKKYVPPLDCVDGAARVLDPIFAFFNGEPLLSGCFLKDFKPRSW